MKIASDKEAFEYIRQHLITQGEKSINEDETCMYRGFLRKDLESILHLQESGDEEYWSEQGINDYYEALADLPKDAMCAVGAIIADEFYEPEIENNSVEDNEYIIDLIRKSNPNWIIDQNSNEMLIVLQRLHDRHTVDEWEEQFKFLEINFNEQNVWTGGLVF